MNGIIEVTANQIDTPMFWSRRATRMIFPKIQNGDEPCWFRWIVCRQDGLNANVGKAADTGVARWNSSAGMVERPRLPLVTPAGTLSNASSVMVAGVFCCSWREPDSPHSPNQRRPGGVFGR